MKRKALSFIIILSIVISFGTFNTVSAEDAPETTFRIVHTNDIHGYYTETKQGQMGFAALKSIINTVQPALVLDAGDTFHGQAFATVEKGLGIAALMDAVGYDATTPGNHDWSYGSSRLRELGENHGFEILASNVVYKDTNADFFSDPYLIKMITADDGTPLTVGVLGVTDETFLSSTVPANVEGLTFLPDTDAANELAETLRNDEDCDLVIALTHQTDPEAFVADTSGIDIVVAGHEHKLIDEVYYDRDGQAVRVVEAGYYFQNIGILSITYDRLNGRIDNDKTEETIFTAADMPAEPDAETLEIISAIEYRQESVLNQVIGESPKDYPYVWEDIRINEQGIGGIVTGAYLHATGADIAIENAGGIRAGLKQGSVTYKDMISISPYGNVIVVCELTGEQILNILEHSIDIGLQCEAIYEKQWEAVEAGEDPYAYSWPDNSGSYLQFGGITAKYNASNSKGRRVMEISVGGETLQPDRVYTAALNNYVKADQDYPDIVAARTLFDISTCEEALIKFIQSGSLTKELDIPGLIRVTSEAPVVSIDPEPELETELEPEPETNVQVKRTVAADTGEIWLPECAYLLLLASSAMYSAAFLRCRKSGR